MRSFDSFHAAYRIHTSEAFQAAVDKVGGFHFQMRGTIQVKVCHCISSIYFSRVQKVT